MDNQKFLFKNPNHLANLNNMRLSGKMCDVTIKVNDKEFQAHKNILAASLKYFDSMFSNSFQETKQGVITMQDVKGVDLEAFISFAYTGEILLTDDNVLSLLELANYLTEDIIKEACINFLVKNLKKEDACRAYKLANTIGCDSLKNASRSIILSHFEYCSQTADYLDFHFDSLKDILINTSSTLASSEVQRLVFEGVMRWIVHDAENRQSYIHELLDIVQITKLNEKFLLEYLCNHVENQEYEATVKDIMSFYRRKSQEMKQSDNFNQSLMIIGHHNKKLQVQFYNFTKKQWGRPHEIIDSSEFDDIEGWTMLNDKIYYMIYADSNDFDYEIYLQVFNPSRKENTMLPYDHRGISQTAMCSCSRFIYFCGGDFHDDGPMSDEVQRYDPLTNLFESMPSMKVERCSAAAIFYQDQLHVLGGGSGPSTTDDLNSVERYDPDTKLWMDFPSMCEERSLHAVAILDGKLYACGGMDKSSVEVYDPLMKNWRLVASMKKVRWNFSLVPYKGKLLAIGGDFEFQQTVEVYDPCKDQWEIDVELSSGIQIDGGVGGLISSTCAY